MPSLIGFLKDKKFAAGEYVSFLDFFLFEQLEVVIFGTRGEILQRFPELVEYHQRVAGLPKFKEFLASERFMRAPFNNRVAKINN